MHGLNPNDTICAIVTPAGHGGLGVVRISGQKASEILQKIWTGKISASDFEPRKLYLGEVANDRVMAVFMPEPNTYTGEDIVEISCHGSPVILDGIIQECIKAGSRIAAPGEFTRRAFLAGKMDLAQAEAVADLIGATSERAAKIASEQIKGRLSSEINQINSSLADIRAQIEASIDFPEEDIETSARDKTISDLDGIILEVKSLLESFTSGRMIKEGVKVVIAGQTNAGKSSIFNALIGQDRAIVHHEHGTTRDVIEDSIKLSGITFRLRDTAGIRDTHSEVETIGITRSHEEIEGADIVLAIFDGHKNFDDSDAELLSKLKPSDTILVINKSDIGRNIDLNKFSNFSPITASAKTGKGIDEIAAHLVSSVKDSKYEDGHIITNSRHKELLDNSIKSLLAAKEAIIQNKPAEITAEILNEAGDNLGGITGLMTTEDILDRIFSKFCIGK